MIGSLQMGQGRPDGVMEDHCAGDPSDHAPGPVRTGAPFVPLPLGVHPFVVTLPPNTHYLSPTVATIGGYDTRLKAEFEGFANEIVYLGESSCRSPVPFITSRP